MERADGAHGEPARVPGARGALAERGRAPRARAQTGVCARGASGRERAPRAVSQRGTCMPRIPERHGTQKDTSNPGKV